MKVIDTLFPVERFEHFSYTQDSKPAYFGDSVLAWREMRLAFSVTPPSLRSVLMIFLRERCSGARTTKPASGHRFIRAIQDLAPNTESRGAN